MSNALHFVECPRDAMQGWPSMIETQQKVDYLNQLLQVGFDTIDFGSFVSPKAIPQMADTKAVLEQLQLQQTKTKLLAIVANVRGATDAVQHGAIDYLGFPLSISETFQQRNTNGSIAEGLNRIDEIQELCIKTNKVLVVYLSMAFGNPYGDEHHESLLLHYANELVSRNIGIISLADTVGLANPAQIGQALQALIPAHANTSFGVHLHSQPNNWQAKVDAALQAGCRRFDGAMKGIGGCPMANDELVGNMDTELLLPYFESLDLRTVKNQDAWLAASSMAGKIFH
jgi:hydroxymethylglutaryl-CoA lyase